MPQSEKDERRPEDVPDEYIDGCASATLDFMEKIFPNIGRLHKLSFFRGMIRGVQARERQEIANFVETSGRLDNQSLARDIRGGKYVKR